MNRKETIFYQEWLQVLQANQDSIKQMVLSLRKESAAALGCLLLRDEGVLILQNTLKVAWPFLQTLRPDDSAAPHPLLVAMVTAALNVGKYGGWEKRGYLTTAMQVITASLFVEKILLSLYELQAWNSPTELAANWWLQELLGAKP